MDRGTHRKIEGRNRCDEHAPADRAHFPDASQHLGSRVPELNRDPLQPDQVSLRASSVPSDPSHAH